MRTMEPSEMWEYSWEEAQLRQMHRDAACSFRESLIWLEEMTEFAKRFSKAPWQKEDILRALSDKK